jgi:hypothetical protein
VSEEARLGSLTHWAYTNRTASKPVTTANERPRREAASGASHFVQALHESEGVSHRGESRREPARKPRRNNADLDSEDLRTVTHRKGGAGKSRANAGDNADSGMPTSAPKRRKVVEKPTPVHTGGTAMERSVSAVTNNGRAVSKDSLNTEVKKRSRAPNAVSTAGRKRYAHMSYCRLFIADSFLRLQKQHNYVQRRLAFGLVACGWHLQSPKERSEPWSYVQ